MPKDKDRIIESAKQWGDALHIQLWYPRNSAIDKIVLGLCDVRAADDIRISYDFDRDGWKIEQASIFEWDGDDPVCDPDWQEVAFVEAWGREKGDELR
jgi:hypothetical protein